MSEPKISRPMTLDDAITHCLQKAQACTACGEEHRQLAAWLSELKKFKEKKSEADKVIAKLKESVKGLILDNYLKDKELRHQKYKRCLAMANACENEEKRLDAIAPIFETDKECWEYFSDYWNKWHKRWLAIAENFKEAM